MRHHAEKGQDEGRKGRRNSLDKGCEAGANVACLGPLRLRVGTLKGQIMEGKAIPFKCIKFGGYHDIQMAKSRQLNRRLKPRSLC